MVGRSVLVVLATSSLVTSAVPDSLKPNTLRTFDQYVLLTEARIQREVAGASPLLWLDRQPADERARLVARLERGEVVSARLQTKDGNKSFDAPGGLIHHWIGTVLLPGVTPARAREVVQDYNRYAEWFSPLIQRARITSHAGDRFSVAMRTEMHK